MGIVLAPHPPVRTRRRRGECHRPPHDRHEPHGRGALHAGDAGPAAGAGPGGGRLLGARPAGRPAHPRLLARGFRPAVAPELASILQEETGAGAVGVTDTDAILGWSGLGGDHHRPGRPIVSPYTQQAIETGEVVFADGIREHYDCPITPPARSTRCSSSRSSWTARWSARCSSSSRAHRRFSSRQPLARGGAGLAPLGPAPGGPLPGAAKGLLTSAGAQAGAGPGQPALPLQRAQHHRRGAARDPERARELLLHLAAFFRKNLKRPADVATLREELEHVGAYLEIREGPLRRPAHRGDRRGPGAARRSPAGLHAPAAGGERLQARPGPAPSGPGTARIRARRDGRRAR